MQEIPTNDDGLEFKMEYRQERVVYEFYNYVDIQESEYSAVVNFRSRNQSGKTKGILGRYNSQYKFKCVDNYNNSVCYLDDFSENVLEDSSSEEAKRISCSWKASFCERSKKLMVDNCLEESDSLKRSYTSFFRLAESQNSDAIWKESNNCFLEACERKILKPKRKRSSFNLL